VGTKTIRVHDDVYEELKAQKRPDESFSDLLERLTDQAGGFEEGFGVLSDVEFERALDELDGLSVENHRT